VDRIPFCFPQKVLDRSPDLARHIAPASVIAKQEEIIGLV
jgi:hypothetical protein